MSLQKTWIKRFIHVDLFYDVKVLGELTFNWVMEISLKYLHLFLKRLVNLEWHEGE